MKINIRADSVEIEGYVNAVERASRPLMSRLGKFIERICAGAFKRALQRADDVHILLDHNWQKDLGSIKRGNLELEEDAIGLRARATITDPEVVGLAKRGELVGWSFGFKDRDVENSTENGMLSRAVKDLDLFEVSIIDRAMIPCYAGTLISTRAIDGGEEVQFRGEPLIDEENEAVENSEENVNENPENVDVRADDVNEKTDEAQNEGESQGENGLIVEKPVEKNANVDYNKYRDMIKTMKEE
jgi:HK97 family phage prohead protease